MLAALLTDFGLDDVYVGVMKAVLLSRCPQARIVDLTHASPPQDVLLGALALEDALPYLPRGSAVVAVVDPGVGSERAALAARVGGRWLLGPDNGLLSWCLGPGAEVVRLETARYRLPELSSTFHGRDVFAPAAAHLLMGAELGEKPEKVTCKGVKGLVDEFKGAAKEMKTPELLDGLIVDAGIKSEHYEIASYGGLVEKSKLMKHDKVAKLLEENLKMEEQFEQQLHQVEKKLGEEIKKKPELVGHKI